MCCLAWQFRTLFYSCGLSAVKINEQLLLLLLLKWGKWADLGHQEVDKWLFRNNLLQFLQLLQRLLHWSTQPETHVDKRQYWDIRGFHIGSQVQCMGAHPFYRPLSRRGLLDASVWCTFSESRLLAASTLSNYISQYASSPGHMNVIKYIHLGGVYKSKSKWTVIVSDPQAVGKAKGKAKI